MFGLRNFSGNCWVNTCIQCVLRIPEVQARYNAGTIDKDNLIDVNLCKIWNSKGAEGLTEFCQSVKTKLMPAGNGIGDSHELLVYLCDKLPFLDELMRFKIAESVKCSNCEYSEMKTDTVIEFSISSLETNTPIGNCISEAVKPSTIEDWKCEKCGKLGCTKQQLIGSFPKVMSFHMIPTNGSIDYSSVLVLNKTQYALVSVACFNGGHWWGYGRNMPPGTPWYSIDDTRLQQHKPNEFPISNRMRLLIYYRIDN